MIDLELRLEPFIPDYIPAVGDIDGFIKVCSLIDPIEKSQNLLIMSCFVINN